MLKRTVQDSNIVAVVVLCRLGWGVWGGVGGGGDLTGLRGISNHLTSFGLSVIGVILSYSNLEIATQ